MEHKRFVLKSEERWRPLLWPADSSSSSSEKLVSYTRYHDIQTFFDFKQFLKYKKKNRDAFETRGEFFPVGKEGGERILAGVNTGGDEVILRQVRFHCGEVATSADSFVCIWPYVHSVPA